MGPHYFQIVRADAAEQVYRERVYCYELYHQLRKCLTNSFPYMLHGELDKSGTPILRDKKPDFVVHEPGNNDRNLLVMEVKPITVDSDGLKKDLDTLNHFLTVAHYKHGIMLIYGVRGREIPKWVFELTLKDGRGQILLFWHGGSGSTPHRIQLSRE